MIEYDRICTHVNLDVFFSMIILYYTHDHNHMSIMYVYIIYTHAIEQTKSCACFLLLLNMFFYTDSIFYRLGFFWGGCTIMYVFFLI